MNSDNRKAAWLTNASTETLERIITTCAPITLAEPTPEHPLAGKVHIEGVGHVRTRFIEAELRLRAEGR